MVHRYPKEPLHWRISKKQHICWHGCRVITSRIRKTPKFTDRYTVLKYRYAIG